MQRPLFECPCVFHERATDCDAGVLTLPAPVLIHPNKAEHSFWMWIASMKPVMSVVAIVLDVKKRPYPKEFRSMLAAGKYICNVFDLPISEHELQKLCHPNGTSAIVHVSNSPVFLSDVTSFRETRILPSDFGQNAICFAWKTSSKFTMPPSSRPKRRKLAVSSISSVEFSDSHAHDVKQLGGKRMRCRTCSPLIPNGTSR